MFTFNEKETEYAKEIVDYFNLYNINSTIYFKHICHSMRIEIYNAYIGRIFKELFGEYSYGKSIHPDILTCDNNLLKSLFLGYYNGDGCINHSFKKKSIKRYEQIQNYGRAAVYSTFGIPIASLLLFSLGASIDPRNKNKPEKNTPYQIPKVRLR